MTLAETPPVVLLTPESTDSGLRYIVALGLGLVFLLSAQLFGSTIAQSVVEEKQTRVVELLISAMPVRALLAGKVLGNTILAMGQILILAAIAVVGLTVTGQNEVLRVIGAPMAWFAVFFLFGFVLLAASIALLVLLVPRADNGWHLAIPLVLAGAGLGLLASQLNNYALAPISEERVGEAAGVTSATGSFGLSFGLAFAGAIMLATLSLSFTNLAESSDVLPPADQERVAQVLEDDAQVMSDAQLAELLDGQPEAVQDEILGIINRAGAAA